ncbi:MAG: hypothetical protein ACREIA_21360 [Opitutaceae bacterium]
MHGVCMRQHQLGESGPDFDAALAELFAGGEAERPGEDVLQRWLDEDQADFDRAVLISQLVSQSEPRVVIPPVAAPAAVAERVRQPARAEPSPAPSRPARGSGSPSVTDLLDGMFAQQGGR